VVWCYISNELFIFNYSTIVTEDKPRELMVFKDSDIAAAFYLMKYTDVFISCTVGRHWDFSFVLIQYASYILSNSLPVQWAKFLHIVKETAAWNFNGNTFIFWQATERWEMREAFLFLLCTSFILSVVAGLWNISLRTRLETWLALSSSPVEGRLWWWGFIASYCEILGYMQCGWYLPSTSPSKFPVDGMFRHWKFIYTFAPFIFL